VHNRLGDLTDCRMKLLETDAILAFMDIGPIAKGHCLVIPKCMAEPRLYALGTS
jgi:diadenosine tetraphosphate (Ap4A) HIT family hydrolase